MCFVMLCYCVVWGDGGFLLVIDGFLVFLVGANKFAVLFAFGILF